MHESKSHSRNSFLTLTYDEEHLPLDRSVEVAHFQKFMKRLRRSSPGGRFRYFHCGEYGEQTARPHYHAAFFGEDFRRGSRPWNQMGGHATWTHPRLNQTWGLGRVVVGTLTVESAQYVARYIMKKQYGPEAEKHYAGRRPEYTTMSRRPGLGEAWYLANKADVYPRDEVVVGKHLRRPPKYYDYLLDQVEPELLKTLKRTRIERAIPISQTELDKEETAVLYESTRYLREPNLHV